MSNQIMPTEANNNHAVAAINANDDFMMGLAELKKRADMVTTIKSQIMRQDIHYGVIPGCGNKPTLLKNGAELLCMAFKLASDAKVEIADLGNGHREYTVTTTLSFIGTGELIATGLGSCSTMESKYRYRGNEMVNTGKPVPKEYWNAKDPATIGGKGFKAKKDESGRWMIFKAGDAKLENPDIADVYNTVLKMASKRSLIDAVLKATGGSCEFTQDLEDMKGNASAAAEYSEPAEYAEAEFVETASAPAPRSAPMNAPRQPKSSFKAELDAMKAADPDAFAKVREKMHSEGWNAPQDIPEDRRQEVRDWFNEIVGNN